MKKWLQAFFIVLVVVGGVWWYQAWKQNRGEISQEATQVEVQPSSQASPAPIEEKQEEIKEHQPVEAGVEDWELWQVIGVVGLMALGTTGLYKLTYRVYWLG